MAVIRRYPLASYLVLACLITWTSQFVTLVLLSRQGWLFRNANLTLLRLLSQLDIVIWQQLADIGSTLGFGPLLAAIVVIWATEGKTGLRRLWQDCTRWKVGFRWYLVIFALPLVLCLVSLGLAMLSTGWGLDYRQPLPLADFLPLLLAMIVFTGIAEEPGWRGFVLPRLQQRWTAEQSSWLLGLMWSLCHVPFFLFLFNFLAAGIAMFILIIFVLTLGIVGWTIVNTWLYNMTASVWVLILLHGWANTAHLYLVASEGDGAAQFLYVLVPWFFAFFLLRRYGADLAPRPRPQR